MKRAEIENLLPAIFRIALRKDNNVLGAMLDAMESLHERPDEVLQRLDAYFDPYRTPDRFIPYLAGWVDLDRFFDRSFKDNARLPQDKEPISTGMGRLRELIHRAAYLSKWRGTQRGLQAFLETATGISGFEVSDDTTDEAGKSLPFHLRVRAPETARPHVALIERIIRSEKPAYVTFAEVEFLTV